MHFSVRRQKMRTGENVTIYMKNETLEQLKFLEKLYGERRSELLRNIVSDAFKDAQQYDTLFEKNEARLKRYEKLSIKSLYDALGREIEKLQKGG